MNEDSKTDETSKNLRCENIGYQKYCCDLIDAFNAFLNAVYRAFGLNNEEKDISDQITEENNHS